jgi:rubrerythrin
MINAPQRDELRVNVQISSKIENEQEAISLYEEINTFVKNIKPDAMVFANISKMLTPCCGGKKP